MNKEQREQQKAEPWRDGEKVGEMKAELESSGERKERAFSEPVLQANTVHLTDPSKPLMTWKL